VPEPASTSSAVRMTKYTHSCVRLERGGRSLVIDPGVWSEPAALMAASAVLITHEHADHIDADRLVATLAGDPACRVFAPAPVAESLSDLGNRFVAVAPGDRFGAAGLDVQVVGGEHAETYEGLPGCANVGYVIEGGGLYHPGDALFVPDVAVETLLVPACAPWLKLAEALDFMHAVRPRRAHPMHDAMLSSIGQEIMDRWLGEKGGGDYARMAIGESVTL